ncbi:MAG: 2-oxoacid:acceptor oxidoreductase family protein [Candidatus Zipacnadales bacterium]
MPQLTEVRWHGRGGQGAKTAGYILAEAAAADGWQIQAFPEYGAERRGAPLRSYVRISDAPIRLRCPVRQPKIIIVLDDTLLGSEDVTAGAPSGALVLVNTVRSPAEVREQLANPDVRVATVDATGIALDTIKRDIPNTPMLGALAKLTDILSLEGAKQAVQQKLAGKLSEAVLKGNLAAIERAYEEVQEG